MLASFKLINSMPHSDRALVSTSAPFSNSYRVNYLVDSVPDGMAVDCLSQVSRIYLHSTSHNLCCFKAALHINKQCIRLMSHAHKKTSAGFSKMSGSQGVLVYSEVL